MKIDYRLGNMGAPEAAQSVNGGYEVPFLITAGVTVAGVQSVVQPAGAATALDV